MKDMLTRLSKPHRIVAFIAGIAMAAALSGCVVYPAGPGYYGHHDYGHDWHGRGGYDRDWR
jgi:hypothetical protein